VFLTSSFHIFRFFRPEAVEANFYSWLSIPYAPVGRPLQIPSQNFFSFSSSFSSAFFFSLTLLTTYAPRHTAPAHTLFSPSSSSPPNRAQPRPQVPHFPTNTQMKDLPIRNDFKPRILPISPPPFTHHGAHPTEYYKIKHLSIQVGGSSVMHLCLVLTCDKLFSWTENSVLLVQAQVLVLVLK